MTVSGVSNTLILLPPAATKMKFFSTVVTSPINAGMVMGMTPGSRGAGIPSPAGTFGESLTTTLSWTRMTTGPGPIPDNSLTESSTVTVS